MLLQPGLCLFHCGRFGADNAPKVGRVVAFDEMGELVNDHVVYDEHRCLDEAPIKIDIAADRTRSPSIKVINDFCSLKFHTKLKSVLKATDEVKGTEDFIRNGEPVAIILNKVYLPATLTKGKNARITNLIGANKTRDIAVLVDLGFDAKGETQSAAVWYETNLSPDETLSFQDLLEVIRK